MAEGEDGLWRCNICDLIFKYKPKYERHKASLKHKALEGYLNQSTSDGEKDMWPLSEWEHSTDVCIDDVPEDAAQIDQVNLFLL